MKIAQNSTDLDLALLKQNLPTNLIYHQNGCDILIPVICIMTKFTYVEKTLQKEFIAVLQ